MFSGWGGKGLGREERGIQEPIKGGDVREKGDMFKVRRMFPFRFFSFFVLIFIQIGYMQYIK